MDTLAVPGAKLHYELRGGGPLLVLAGAPMDADAFAPLAGLLAADFTVLTADPRGIHRSPVDEPDADVTPEQRADDLAALIAHVDAGQAVALGSSGGAVSVLALAARHPHLVHTVIPHEPPLDELLPDRAELRAATEEMIATYLAGDVAGAWARFMRIANIDLPPGAIEQMFLADRSPQNVADEHFQFAHMLRGTVRYVPDVSLLAPMRVRPAIGADSAGELCDRATRALCAQLGVEPLMFPGGHVGFAEDPAAFAARLREVLA